MKPISLKEYLIAGAIGFLIGLRLLGPALGLVYMGGGAACIYFAFKNDHYRLFTVMPYMVYTEIFIRAELVVIPYLFMPYLMVAVFAIMLLNQKGQLKMHSRATLPIFFYTVIELLDTIRAADAQYARSMVTNSIVLTLVALWASANAFKPYLTSHVLKHLALASVYMCGNILVAHFTHDISYSTVSNSEATNRMAPVQVSGYLGVGSALLFLYILEEKKKQKLLMHIIVLSITVILMLLTFSRGGLYFLASVMIAYVLFNWKQIGRFAIFLLFVPVGYVIYYYVTNATDGLIEARYSSEGASGREDLVKAGFAIFSDEPLAGVGTGNYGSEIKNRNLFSVESGAHNEFVTAAAEHGIFGIVLYWGFYIVILMEVLSRKKQERDLAFYFLLLYCLIIVHNGLKISVQPYILAIVIATPTLIRVPKRKDVQLTQYSAGTT